MSFRFRMFTLSLCVIAVMVSLHVIFPWPTCESQQLSCQFRLFRGTISVKVGRRTTVKQEGFGLPASEGWVEWR